MDFLGNIYDTLFSWLYGSHLKDYLWGLNPETSEYTQPFLYPRLWAMPLVVAGGLGLLYYKVIDHPRLANLWAWLAVWVLNVFLVMAHIVGSQNAAAQAGTIGMEHVTSQDIFGLAIAQGIVATVYFLGASFVLRFLSTSCRYTPFRFGN